MTEIEIIFDIFENIVAYLFIGVCTVGYRAFLTRNKLSQGVSSNSRFSTNYKTMKINIKRRAVLDTNYLI